MTFNYNDNNFIKTLKSHLGNWPRDFIIAKICLNNHNFNLLIAHAYTYAKGKLMQSLTDYSAIKEVKNNLKKDAKYTTAY